MSYRGDVRLGATHDFKFTTRQVSGAPHSLAGSPVVSAYVGNNTTQITAGITLTTDFDGVVGLNNLRVVFSSANGFAIATDVSFVITTGTVNSVSVVGEEALSVSIENRPLGLNAIKADSFSANTGLKPDFEGTATAGATQSITFPASASSVTDFFKRHMIKVYEGTGAGQVAIILSYNGTTKIAQVDFPWAVIPDSTSKFVTFASVNAAGDVADAVWDELLGDSTITGRQAMRLFLAALAGKLSGAATATITIRNVGDNKDVIIATVDALGNRSVLTLNP
jgi:hypothetical protein